MTPEQLEARHIELAGDPDAIEDAVRAQRPPRGHRPYLTVDGEIRFAVYHWPDRSPQTGLNGQSALTNHLAQLPRDGYAWLNE